MKTLILTLILTLLIAVGCSHESTTVDSAGDGTVDASSETSTDLSAGDSADLDAGSGQIGDLSADSFESDEERYGEVLDASN